ncbi:hypothetical protein OAM67_01750 [bacterium]|nr:hypothetical protein [bacterium]
MTSVMTVRAGEAAAAGGAAPAKAAAPAEEPALVLAVPTREDQGARDNPVLKAYLAANKYPVIEITETVDLGARDGRTGLTQQARKRALHGLLSKKLQELVFARKSPTVDWYHVQYVGPGKSRTLCRALLGVSRTGQDMTGTQRTWSNWLNKGPKKRGTSRMLDRKQWYYFCTHPAISGGEPTLRALTRPSKGVVDVSGLAHTVKDLVCRMVEQAALMEALRADHMELKQTVKALQVDNIKLQQTVDELVASVPSDATIQAFMAGNGAATFATPSATPSASTSAPSTPRALHSSAAQSLLAGQAAAAAAAAALAAPSASPATPTSASSASPASPAATRSAQKRPHSQITTGAGAGTVAREGTGAVADEGAATGHPDWLSQLRTPTPSGGFDVLNSTPSGAQGAGGVGGAIDALNVWAELMAASTPLRH